MFEAHPKKKCGGSHGLQITGCAVSLLLLQIINECTMIKKEIYYIGDTRITEIRLFGLLIYKSVYEHYLSELAELRGH